MWGRRDHRAGRDGLAEQAGGWAASDARGLLAQWRRRDRWRLGVTVTLVWALLILRMWPEHPWAVPGYLAVAAVAVVLADIDRRTRLLPNLLTYPAFGVAMICSVPPRCCRASPFGSSTRWAPRVRLGLLEVAAPK